MGFLDKIRGRPPESAKKLGRNDPCWCGSGKKYKKCHLESDQKYFADHKPLTCNKFG
jgi:hypothetical protein